MASLVLFCGGDKFYGENNPKPLMSFDGKVLILEYLERISKLKFDSIFLLVEDDDFKKFQSLLKNKNLKIVPVSNCSSTLLKTNKLLKEYYEEICEDIFFSYPDIIYDEEIFDTTFNSFLNIKITPLKSRFPEIIRDRFSENIKGISVFDSPVPANPTYIYAGVASVKKQILVENLNDFLEKNGMDSNFEVDFFQYMISKNLAKYQNYFGNWKTIDSVKDFYQSF